MPLRYWFDDVPHVEFENNATATDVWVALSTELLAGHLVNRGVGLPDEVAAVFPRRDALPDVIAHPEPVLLRVAGAHVLGGTVSLGPLKGFYCVYGGHWVVGMVSSHGPLNLSEAPGPTADRWPALN